MYGDFGSELRRRRTKRGVSITKFAGMVHCSKGHISRVERGLAAASLAFAQACDDVLAADGELVTLAEAEKLSRTRCRDMKVVVGLPASPSNFVGRSDELVRIADFLAADSVTPVCVISGLSGAGKTALALRGAWNASEDFPDGCFFFDFEDDSPGSSRDVLDSLLRLLGVPADQMPSRSDALANLWRNRIRGKRLLLVLDNVRSAADVTPLLSAESGCKLIVTSRKRLSGLDDAIHLSVDILSGVEADALFRAVGGERAAGANGQAVRSVVEYCDRLPLAVRIIAARFRHGPMRTVAELEEMLSCEAYRLELLDDGDRSVAAALSVSCNGLTKEERRLLALLVLHPGAGIDLHSVAALADVDLPRARMLMDALAQVHLVTYESSRRLRTHGLVRQFARNMLLPHVPDEEQHAAIRRLLDHGLRLAVTADKLLTPQRYRPPVILDDFPERPAPFTDRAAALRWLESEWRNLVALCRTAAAHRMHSLCWQLAFALREFFFLKKLWGPWIETHVTAVEAARSAGARAWQAISLGNLGVAHADRGDLTMAVGYFRKSLDLYQQLDDEHGVVNAISNIAWVELYLGEYGNSLHGLRAALKCYRRLGNRRNAAIALRGIALLEAELELCPAAVEHAREAGEEFRALGLDLDVVMSVNCAAWAQFRSGDHQAAGASYQEALALADICGSRYEKARALTGLGNIHQAAGDMDTADELWARADALYGGFAPVMLGEARVRLAS
ncbi:helix-turn-helix domain-containing protein [Streptomyces achromogenes]|uniref:helix-turn-helix domain-containing protein n=1 Tax=Streptomyces achromogenes TaxID=67255 RepID=UPI0036F4D16B